MSNTIPSDEKVVPSKYQAAILDNYGIHNMIVQAVAGSGKSKTLEMLVTEKNGRMHRACLLAFNKPIATVLKNRGLPAYTFNGLGFGVTNYSFRGSVLNADKVADCTKRRMTPHDMKLMGAAVLNLVAKSYTIGLVPDHRLLNTKGLVAVTREQPQVWQDLIETYDIDTMSPEGEDLTDTIIDFSRNILAECLADTRTLSFDDQISFPVLYNLPMKPYDHLLVDEAQDTNLIQIAFLRKALGRNGVFTAVGDRNQSLYKFRGAASDAMDRIKREFKCVEYPLSICYRCPQVVIRAAQQFVPQIEAAPGKPEGVMQHLPKFGPKTFRTGDVIVSRKNADLVSLAYKLMAARIPCGILGRDMVGGLITLMEKIEANYMAQRRTENQISFLIESLESWRDREIEKAKIKDNESKIQATTYNF